MTAGKGKAIATKGEVMAGGGTTLEERSVTVTDKIDWVSLSIFRGGNAKRANNEVRAMFMKSVADMFGGERNIPDSVKEAIENLNRGNAFDKANDPNGELANKAFAAGYTRLDFGKLNTAANLLAKMNGASLHDAMEEVVTRGSAANRAMNAGSLYMKDVNSFRDGYNGLKHVANDDARNLEVARLCASEASAGGLSEIARNLAYKFRNILNDAEKFRIAANLPENIFDELRTVANGLADEMGNVADGIAGNELKSRKEICRRLFESQDVYR